MMPKKSMRWPAWATHSMGTSPSSRAPAMTFGTVRIGSSGSHTSLMAASTGTR